MATSDYTTLELPLSRNLTAVIDNEDSDLSEFKWHSHSDGYRFYAVRNRHTESRRTTQQLHRVILERILNRSLAKGEFVDHINGNGLDNRRCNLRLANNAENCRNKRRDTRNSSGYKGVGFSKSSHKWRARIMVNNKSIWLGLFNTPEEAHKAYCEAAIHYFGDFARLE